MICLFSHNRLIPFITFAFILYLLIPTSIQARKYTVFSDGESDYVIVIASSASESEAYAAKELQAVLKKVGNVSLPIVGEGEGRRGKRIIIGYNADSKILLRGLKQPLSDDEGFLYKNERGDIVIVGGCERGTMYGVFSFLEKEFGCKWLTETCSIIPTKKEYCFTSLDFSDKPVFKRRSLLYSEFSAPFFRAHSRVNERIMTDPRKPPTQIGDGYYFLSPHTMHFFLSTDKYYNAHPECFALVNGKRRKENPQPCFTAPRTFSICLSELKEVISTYPHFSIIEISALDNYNRCQCKECQKAIELLGSYTDLVLDFVNRIADIVLIDYPDKQIEFLAYSNTRTPPKTVKPHPNVLIRFCGVEACHTHGISLCSQEKTSRVYSDLLDWRRLTNNISIWEYATDFAWYNIPFPNIYAFRDNLLTYQNIGVQDVFVEGNHYSNYGEFYALRIYIISKLLWNPNYCVEDLVNEFMDGYYGSSALYMRQYFDLLYSCILPDTHLGTFANYTESYYNNELVNRALTIFEKAKKAASDKETLRRVELEELSVNVLKCVRTPKESIKDGTSEQVKRIIEKERIRIGQENSIMIYNRLLSSSISNSLLITKVMKGVVAWKEAAGEWLRGLFRHEENRAVMVPT